MSLVTQGLGDDDQITQGLGESGGGGGGTETVEVSPAYRIIDTAGVSNWTGDAPFALVDGGSAEIIEQNVINTHKVYIVISGNGNPGPYFVTDGVLSNIRLPALFISGMGGSLITVTTSGGLA